MCWEYEKLTNEEFLNAASRFNHSLIEWGKENMRDYPWRKTDDPYQVMIAEIMLHRTRAEQVREVYERFVRKYPNFESITGERKEVIVSELSALGLQWRFELLHEMAEEIVDKYDGLIPNEMDKLLSLPGVGPYIAGAVLCFVENRAVPLLDTNTVRVIGRFFGMKVSDSSRRSEKFRQIMQELVNSGNPRLFSFSMIDLAAEICLPRNPQCTRCPVKDSCCFYERREVSE